MIVQKFGGTSVANADRIRAAAEIVRSHAARRPVVVVSALAGVTDLLVAAIAAAGAGRLDALEPILADLERRHRWALAGLFENARGRHDLTLALDERFEELRQLLRAIRVLGEATPRAADTLLAFGELLSSRLVEAQLQARGVAALWVDPTQIVRTDARFGSAEPDLEATAELCRAVLVPALDSGLVPVLGGFVGATAEGIPTTLGRGGSDTTAAVVGACLGAEEIQIWTDVDGILTADPRLVPSASTVATVSFAEAAELAHCGAKVLHPASIAPAVERGIPVQVRNAARPDHPGTTVLRSARGRRAEVASIASRHGLALLCVRSVDMRHDPDRLATVLAAVRRNGVTPALAVASELGVALAVADGPSAAAAAHELAVHGDVELHTRRAAVSVVGERLTTDAGLRAAVLSAFAEISAEMLSTGASATGMTAILPEASLEPAVRALHGRFFGGREG